MARTGLLLIKKSGAKSQIKPVEHAQQHTMEQNNADIPVAAVVQNIVHADARPANACCTPQCGFCGLITLICLLVSGIPMLIAGAYYYSIYDQHSGIEYQQTTCFLENAWYETTVDVSYDVKINVNYTIEGEIWRKTMTYNNYVDLADAQLISTFLIQFSPNITCYGHPLNESPVRAPLDVHQNFVDGVGLLVPALVLLTGSTVGITLVCVFYNKGNRRQVAALRRRHEQRIEQEQRR